MTEINEFREAKDHFFGHDHQAPLTHEQQATFDGLNYYKECDDLKYVIEPDLIDGHDIIEMQTSAGDVTSYQRWGTISFDLKGAPAKLTLYPRRSRRQVLSAVRRWNQRVGDLRRRTLP